MTTKIDDLQGRVGEALLELAHTDTATALSIATGVFVSLTLAVMRGEGLDVDRQIYIDGGDQRDITIHATKKKSQQCVIHRSSSRPDLALCAEHLADGAKLVIDALDELIAEHGNLPISDALADRLIESVGLLDRAQSALAAARGEGSIHA
ncbi:hypothetical protein H0A66_08735 [Alcaligenaceae bacterium]|nr:hypothetical protein [Alcaligenaceae bacterium]